jgi:DNA-binding winged helix-turn-helix (wHTH) protein
MHTPQQFCFEAYRLDVPNEQHWHGPRPLHLTPKAARVLHYLLEHAGQLVTKVELFQSVWPEAMVSDEVLTNCISELRQALEDPAQAPRFIQTVHRRGYRFLVPVTVAAGRAAADNVNPLPPCDRAPRLGPVVGRETEVVYLRRCLEKARQGTRQVVFVTGEAGMGKTTVVDAFLAAVGGEAPIRVAWGQCLDHYGAGEAYLPVLDALGRLCREPGQAQLRALLD